MMNSVLLLSTYPIVDPRHGGQLRLANIADAYRNAGWTVQHAAIYEPGAYDPSTVGPLDIPFPSDSPHRLYEGLPCPAMSDLLSGRFAISDASVVRRIASKMPTSLSAIHVEQPWLWPLARALRDGQADKPLLVYGSQNVEAPLKDAILRAAGFARRDQIVAEAHELERAATREADVVFAVTLNDLAVYQTWGARRAYLAPNGVSPWKAEEEALTRWESALPRKPWLLYVASAHPPNYNGFARCLGDTLGCFPPESKLVVAGGVSALIEREFAVTRWNTLNLSKLQLLHSLNSSDFAAVKELAPGYLLPVPGGGGSNIKTAEALYSGRYVVCSETALRGFEPFIDQPGVFVARNPQEFSKHIRKVMELALSRLAPERSPELMETLLWRHCVGGIPAKVANCRKINYGK